MFLAEQTAGLRLTAFLRSRYPRSQCQQNHAGRLFDTANMRSLEDETTRRAETVHPQVEQGEAPKTENN